MALYEAVEWVGENIEYKTLTFVWGACDHEEQAREGRQSVIAVIWFLFMFKV